MSALCVLAGSADAQVLRDLPQLEDVGVTEHLGASLPVDLEFTDEDGRIAPLKNYLGADKPTVVILGYYGCPMLCGLVLNGFLDSAKNIPWTIGREYDVVYVSIDPNEMPDLAARKKQSVLTAYARENAAAGWHFLTARAANSQALADAIGFRYQYVEERKEYAHPSLVTLVGPDGRIMRYLYGVQFPPQTLRFGLVEASQGHTVTTMDQLLLYCFHYDSNEGRYVIAAQNFMKIGGGLTLTALAFWLVPVWVRARRAAHAGAAA